MSIQSEINRISQNVSDSLSAVAAKGVVVPSGSTSDDLPDLIAAIQSGSGSAVTVTETQDQNGGTIVSITAVDLTGDTVSASSLLSGYTAHNSLGQSITGTYVAPSVTEPDCPVFTILNNSTGQQISASCNKTFAECVELISDTTDNIIAAIIRESGEEGEGVPESWEHACNCGHYYDSSSGLDYLKYYGTGGDGVPVFQLTYYSDGTIVSGNDNIEGLVTLNATQNGTYDNYPTSVYKQVVVNVPAGTVPVFTLTWNAASTNISSITCNKTFAQCVAMIQDNTNMVYGALGYETMTGSDMSHWFGLTGYILNDPQTGDPACAKYYGTDAFGVPAIQIDYYSDGTILRSGTPDSLTSLNVSTNGTYNAPNGSVYNSVVVSVPTGTARTSSDLTASGATVTVPAGLYSSQATKTIASGSATVPSNVTGNSATVSTGTNTLTLSKQISITPYVDPGYISAGTAENVSVSLTASVVTQGTRTITPTKSAQTIASGTYLTGTQTIAAIPAAYQDVTGVTAAAGDVVSGKDIVNSSGTVVHGSLVIQHYYTGSGAPSSSTGVNGDIYLQTS